MSVLPPVNLSYLQEYTDGDEGMINELIEVFKETVSESVADLKKAISESEIVTWQEAAHKLKGAAGYIGAEKLKALCAVAQDMQTATPSEREKAFNEIELALKDVANFLEQRAS